MLEALHIFSNAQHLIAVRSIHKRRSKMKRFSVLLLVAALAFALFAFTACSNEEDAVTPDPDVEDTQPPADDPAPDPDPEPDPEPAEPGERVPGIEGWVPFENRVLLTVPVYERNREGFPDVANHYWTDWIQREFGDVWNVDVQFVPIPRGEVIMHYNLLMAAQDLPVIMMEYDYPILSQWAYDGALAVIDLDDFAFYAPNYFQGMVDRGQLIYTDIGGNTHLILSERPFYNTPLFHYTFIRMDWLREVGFDTVPRDRDTMNAARDAIIEAGLTDIPPAGFVVPAERFAGMTGGWGMRDFPVSEEEWAMHSSLMTTPVNWAPTREWLRNINEEFHLGHFSEEFELRSGPDDEADFIAGRLMAHGGFVSAHTPWLNAFFEMNPDAELAVAPVFYDHQARSDNPFGAIVGFSSLASEDQLRAAWMYMEWMLQPEILDVLQLGYEGINWEYDEDGNIIRHVEYEGLTRLHHNNNVDIWMIVMASEVRGTAEEIIARHAPQGLPQCFEAEMLANYRFIREAANAGRIYPDIFFSVPIPAESEYVSTLHGLLQEWFSRLVRVAPADFDALYDEFEAAYLAAGYQTIIDQRLQAFRDGDSTRLPANVRQ